MVSFSIIPMCTSKILNFKLNYYQHAQTDELRVCIWWNKKFKKNKSLYEKNHIWPLIGKLKEDKSSQ